MKIRARFTTPVSFWEKVPAYIPGEGPKTKWVLYTEGAMSVFPCEWRNKWMAGKNRNETFSGDSDGFLERISVRMPYIPGLYDKLHSESIVVIKGGLSDTKTVDVSTYNQGRFNLSPMNRQEGRKTPDLTGLNAYQVFGGVDNIYDEGHYMEFFLKRYEATA